MSSQNSIISTEKPNKTYKQSFKKFYDEIDEKEEKLLESSINSINDEEYINSLNESKMRINTNWKNNKNFKFTNPINNINFSLNSQNTDNIPNKKNLPIDFEKELNIDNCSNKLKSQSFRKDIKNSNFSSLKFSISQKDQNEDKNKDLKLVHDYENNYDENNYDKISNKSNTFANHSFIENVENSDNKKENRKIKGKQLRLGYVNLKNTAETLKINKTQNNKINLKTNTSSNNSNNNSSFMNILQDHTFLGEKNLKKDLKSNYNNIFNLTENNKIKIINESKNEIPSINNELNNTHIQKFSINNFNNNKNSHKPNKESGLFSEVNNEYIGKNYNYKRIDKNLKNNVNDKLATSQINKNSQIISHYNNYDNKNPSINKILNYNKKYNNNPSGEDNNNYNNIGYPANNLLTSNISKNYENKENNVNKNHDYDLDFSNFNKNLGNTPNKQNKINGRYSKENNNHFQILNQEMNKPELDTYVNSENDSDLELFTDEKKYFSNLNNNYRVGKYNDRINSNDSIFLPKNINLLNSDFDKIREETEEYAENDSQ